MFWLGMLVGIAIGIAVSLGGMIVHDKGPT